MKLLFAFFAESSSLEHDGVFSVLRGGLDKLMAPGFPAVVDHLVLLMRVQLEREEFNQNWRFVVAMIDPIGNRMSPDLIAAILPNQARKFTDREGNFTLRFLYDNFEIKMAGTYRFQLFVDEQLLGEATIEAVQESMP